MAKTVKAVAYLRTSSATNVGADKDSDKRQRDAIAAFAKRAGFEIVAEFYDADVKGSDHVSARPGFAAMMERIAGNGVRTIIVETANRFARDLIVQETGYAMLKGQGIDLIAADSPGAFLEETPTAVLIRQILGAVSQFEKAMLVTKLKGARDRKRKDLEKTSKGKPVKVEGRKGHAELRPEVVAEAKRLHRASPKTGKRRSLREIAAELAAAGFLNERGKPYAAQSIANMLEGA